MQIRNSTPSHRTHIPCGEAPSTDLLNWHQTRVMTFPGQYFTLRDQPGRHYESISMGEILRLVRQPATARKEDAPATIGSNYGGHDARTHDVQAEKGQYSLLRFDIDAGNPSLQDVCTAFRQSLGEGAFMVYSTSSATPDSRRWRVLVPLLVPVSHEFRQATEGVLRQDIEMLWGFEFDQVLDRAGQHIYLPAVAPHKRDADGAPIYYEWEVCGATPLDLEHSSLYPKVQSQINQSRHQERRRQAALEEQREKQRLKRESVRQTGEATLSPIDWFNHHHSLEDVPLLEVNNKKERYLSVEEAQRLYEVVCQSENAMLKYVVPMLILTGARKREVLDAKWQDFDFSRRVWRIPMSKSGRARHVPLSDGAMTLLSTMPRKPGCDWAFANPDTGKPYVSIFYAWNVARKQAGLSDVRLHDLRHSFASLLINSGRTLYEVQHILGHTQVKTTQRYAHLSQDTLLAAANAATVAVGAVMLPQAVLAPVSALPAALRA